MGLRDFGKAALSLVADVEEDPKPKGDGDDSAGGDEPKRKPASVPVHRVSNGPADEEYVRILAGLVEKSTKPGYTEFAGQLEALAEDIPEEGRRYKAALKSAARAHGGLDKAAVLGAIDDRIGILGDYAAQFDADVAKEEKQKVGTAEAELASVEQQIEELIKSRDAMRSELAANKTRFTVKREKFGGAHNALAAKLAEERRKVDTYLQG